MNDWNNTANTVRADKFLLLSFVFVKTNGDIFFILKT